MVGVVLGEDDFPEQTILIRQYFYYINEIVIQISKLIDNYCYIEMAVYLEFYPKSENVTDVLKNFQKTFYPGSNEVITEYLYSNSVVIFIFIFEKVFRNTDKSFNNSRNYPSQKFLNINDIF